MSGKNHFRKHDIPSTISRSLDLHLQTAHTCLLGDQQFGDSLLGCLLLDLLDGSTESIDIYFL